MVQHVLLRNVEHRDLRVITRYGAEFGDNVTSVPAVPTEFEELQREYPIFFRKDPKSGEFSALALLGFEKNENLFLDGDAWDARYIPAYVARGPFLIGFQSPGEQSNEAAQAMIHVDLDHPRISRTEGNPLFLPQGGNSAYLQRIGRILHGLSRGLAMNSAMFAAFTAAEIIEPVNVELRFSEQEQHNLRGLHTIHREKLAALSGAALESLHRAGFLQGAFLVMASLGNIQKMIEIKQRRRLSASSTQADMAS